MSCWPAPRPTGGKRITSVLGREIGVLRHVLRADVVVGYGDLVEGEAPPAFVLRIDPGVEQRDAGGLGGVRLHRRRRGERHGLEPEVGDCLAEVLGADAAANDERATVELLALSLERLFGNVELGVLEAIPQRRERRVCVVIDGEEAARAGDAAGSRQFALDELERGLEHLRVRDANDLDVEELPERPPRVVVRVALRVVWRPGTW